MTRTRPKIAFAATLFVTTLLVGCHSVRGPERVHQGTAARQVMPFDANWRFFKGDAPDAEQPAFNDAAWRQLDVPHDWSIEGPFSRTNRTGGAGGFLPAGVGWYRKHFTLPTADSARRVFIEFDGVMANSDVWINGQLLGHRPYGYVSFCYELTGHLNFGPDKENLLAVRADDSEQPASRWYAGAGIYRHVRLVTTEPIHIAHWGVFVTTPTATTAAATVQIETSLTNQSAAAGEVRLETTLVDPNGREVGRIQTSSSLEPGHHLLVRQNIIFKRPRLWDIDHPQLYQVVSRLFRGDRLVDDQVTPFGIRHFEFKPDTGFWLNGRNFKLKGVCLHHDGGAFGAAVPLHVWEQRLQELRKLGVNAIRTAHNPPAPEFLDLCDRMGFLVMDEFFDCWTVGKNRYDYHLYFRDWSKIDERDTVLRDRNHPSVILYSVGNEIRDTPRAEMAKVILKELVDVCHENDPTRPVTQGLFRPNVSHDYDNGLADLLDVIGQNYRENEILAAHRQDPRRKIVGTENRHDRLTWLALRDNAPYAGQFLWTGVDYLGESRRWPVIGYSSGLLDRTGAPRPVAYERQSWWSDRPMVFIARRSAPTDLMPTDPGYGLPERYRQVLFSDWTPSNSKPHDENVEVYSNCREVELFLNGRSLGAKPLNADASPRNWTVPFEPGTIKAVGRNGGKVVTSCELHTAGKPARIALTTDQKKLAADWSDVAIVRATVVDNRGVVVPNTSDPITFTVSGAGRIAAVDNGDNNSHEPFQTNERNAFQGRCVAFVQATASRGRITVKASAPDLEGAAVSMEIVPPR